MLLSCRPKGSWKFGGDVVVMSHSPQLLSIFLSLAGVFHCLDLNPSSLEV